MNFAFFLTSFGVTLSPSFQPAMATNAPKFLFPSRI